MRISAGKLKGRNIGPKSSGFGSRRGGLRPTSAKARESIFNILGESIRGSIFVDMYAGTGAVGMEAISREAGYVFFVDADRGRAKMIEDAVDRCSCGSSAKVVNSRAEDFVVKAGREGLKFDIIFLDPPYHTEELDSVLSLLASVDLLKAGGILIAEHFSKKQLQDKIGVLIKKRTYKYGDTVLTLFRKEI